MKGEDLMAKLDLSLADVKYQLANLQKEKYLLRIEGRKSGRWKVLVCIMINRAYDSFDEVHRDHDNEGVDWHVQ